MTTPENASPENASPENASDGAAKDKTAPDTWWRRLLQWLVAGAEKSRKSSGCFT